MTIADDALAVARTAAPTAPSRASGKRIGLVIVGLRRQRRPDGKRWLNGGGTRGAVTWMRSALELQSRTNPDGSRLAGNNADLRAASASYGPAKFDMFIEHILAVKLERIAAEVEAER